MSKDEKEQYEMDGVEVNDKTEEKPKKARVYGDPVVIIE
jgi:hypothetical protein